MINTLALICMMISIHSKTLKQTVKTATSVTSHILLLMICSVSWPCLTILNCDSFCQWKSSTSLRTVQTLLSLKRNWRSSLLSLKKMQWLEIIIIRNCMHRRESWYLWSFINVSSFSWEKCSLRCRKWSRLNITALNFSVLSNWCLNTVIWQKISSSSLLSAVKQVMQYFTIWLTSINKTLK